MFLGSPTGFKADIIFVVDSSSEISRIDFEREKAFVKQMSRLLNVHQGQSRAALVTYGTRPKTVFSFGGSDDAVLFGKAVDLAPFVGGERRLDRVLPSITQILTEARPQVSTFLIITCIILY